MENKKMEICLISNPLTTHLFSIVHNNDKDKRMLRVSKLISVTTK